MQKHDLTCAVKFFNPDSEETALPDYGTLLHR